MKHPHYTSHAELIGTYHVQAYRLTATRTTYPVLVKYYELYESLSLMYAVMSDNAHLVELFTHLRSPRLVNNEYIEDIARHSVMHDSTNVMAYAIQAYRGDSQALIRNLTKEAIRGNHLEALTYLNEKAAIHQSCRANWNI